MYLIKLLIINLSGNRRAIISTKDLGIPQKRKFVTDSIIKETDPHLVLAQECCVMTTKSMDSNDFQIFGNKESCIGISLKCPYIIFEQHKKINLFRSEFEENEQKRMSTVLIEITEEKANELVNGDAENASFQEFSSETNENLKKRKFAESFETASEYDRLNPKKKKIPDSKHVIVISWHGPYQRPDKKGPYREQEKKTMIKQIVAKILRYTIKYNLSFIMGGDFNVNLTTIDFGSQIKIYDYEKSTHRKHKFDFLMSSNDIHGKTTKIIDINHIISSKYPELQEKSVDCHTELSTTDGGSHGGRSYRRQMVDHMEVGVISTTDGGSHGDTGSHGGRSYQRQMVDHMEVGVISTTDGGSHGGRSYQPQMVDHMEVGVISKTDGGSRGGSSHQRQMVDHMENMSIHMKPCSEG
ncbi:unnamed protein product [Mytilus coruscus]|uniref:Endonuclease/exonuclease/phosphatase domain-containing protein n=1 Tax=Mytilus coruscus TaxID=42192 RepID=A0A6J8BUJ8_MYTCO|nr:unnamed protein product [Mytilus coruscus]